jgi:hypothetical protein
MDILDQMRQITGALERSGQPEGVCGSEGGSLSFGGVGWRE